jgi:acetyl esterase
MAADPSLLEILADRRNEMRAPRAGLPIEELRRHAAAFMARTAIAPAVTAIEEHAFAGPQGRVITVRLYRPAPEGAAGCILFCHGGGFVFGDLDSHDGMCRLLAGFSGGVVVAVAYHRAPEYQFPTPIADCTAAAEWLYQNRGTLGLPTGLALVGDSAGGHIAIGVTLALSGGRQPVRHLGLLYPMIDPTCSTTSLDAYGKGGYLMTRSAIEWFWKAYLPATAVGDPRAAVLQADLRGFPPTTIITAQFDPLRDEDEAFAAKLRAAGVPVEVHSYAGMVHGFAGLSHVTPLAQDALKMMGERIRDATRVQAAAS